LISFSLAHSVNGVDRFNLDEVDGDDVSAFTTAANLLLCLAVTTAVGAKAAQQQLLPIAAVIKTEA
jgi:hypothetical protein